MKPLDVLQTVPVNSWQNRVSDLADTDKTYQAITTAKDNWMHPCLSYIRYVQLAAIYLIAQLPRLATPGRLSAPTFLFILSYIPT